MGEPQHANHAVQETRCLAELGERGLTAWGRRLEETDEVEHINGRLERRNATQRFPQPSQSRPGDSLRLLCAEWAEHRMPLPDVLARLEAMVVAATASSSEAEVAEAEEARGFASSAGMRDARCASRAATP